MSAGRRPIRFPGNPASPYDGVDMSLRHGNLQNIPFGCASAIGNSSTVGRDRWTTKPIGDAINHTPASVGGIDNGQGVFEVTAADDQATAIGKPAGAPADLAEIARRAGRPGHDPKLRTETDSEPGPIRRELHPVDCALRRRRQLLWRAALERDRPRFAIAINTRVFPSGWSAGAEAFSMTSSACLRSLQFPTSRHEELL